MRQALSEDLINNLCLDSVHCEKMSGNIMPDKSYDFSILSMPTVSEIEADIQRKLKMNFWGKILQFVEEEKTAYICLFTLLFQSLLIIFTFIDFCSGSKNNVIRIFLSLLVKLL